MKYGVHLSSAGGPEKLARDAEFLECEAIQVFSRNPRGWGRAKPVEEIHGKTVKEHLKGVGVEVLVIHIPYLVNLASPEEDIYNKSYNLFRDDLVRADAMGADHLVIHPGSHRGQGTEAGIRQIASSIRKAWEEVNPQVTMVLENVAGAGTEVGGRFEELKLILELINLDHDRVGICFDTCHALVSGYPVATEEDLAETMDSFDEIIGLEWIKLVHANDSKGSLGSRLDRHEHIGEGYIGLEGFKAIVNSPALKDLPAILETPKKSIDDDVRNLKVIRDLDENLR